MDGKRRRRRHRREGFSWQGVLTVLVFAAFLLLYRGVLAGLVRQWLGDDNYSHGLVVPLVAAMLLYRRLPRIPRRDEPGVRAGLPLLASGLGLFVVGQAAAELFTLRVSMLLVLWGLVRGIWGPRTFRTLRFPLLFLIFMVPLPYVVFFRAAFPLQLASAAASAEVLEWMGVPLVRTGNILHLQELSLDVVTACSGLRSLLALLACGVLAAGLFKMRWRHRVLIVLLAVPTAMASNALRIVLTGVFVHSGGEAFLEGTFHEALGLATFALGLVVLFTLGAGFRWQPRSARGSYY